MEEVTALVLVKLCKHLGLDYFLINDFDFEEDFIEKLATFDSYDEYKKSEFYSNQIKDIKAKNAKNQDLDEKTKKSMATTNFKLINEAGIEENPF